MGILYRQEDDGFKHVIEIREDWKFDDRKDFDACVKFLTDNGIPFGVDYSFELFHVKLQNSTWTAEVQTRDKQYIDLNDKAAKQMFIELFEWKCKGTRPNPDLDDLDISLISEYTPISTDTTTGSGSYYS